MHHLIPKLRKSQINATKITATSRLVIVEMKDCIPQALAEALVVVGVGVVAGTTFPLLQRFVVQE